MKINFLVQFIHRGVEPVDDFELNNPNEEVKRKSDRLIDDLILAVDTEKCLPPLPWPGDWDLPPTKVQKKAFEEYVTEHLALASLELVAEKIEKQFNSKWDSIKRTINLVDEKSELLKIVNEKKPPNYELRPAGSSLCRPCGQGCHICVGQLFFTSPSKQFVRSIPSNNELFNYFLFCKIRFLLGE